MIENNAGSSIVNNNKQQITKSQSHEKGTNKKDIPNKIIENPSKKIDLALDALSENNELQLEDNDEYKALTIAKNIWKKFIEHLKKDNVELDSNIIRLIYVNKKSLKFMVESPSQYEKIKLEKNLKDVSVFKATLLANEIDSAITNPTIIKITDKTYIT